MGEGGSMGEEGNNFSWIFYIRVNKSNRALWIYFFFINEELPVTSICTVETHRKNFISTIDVPLNFEAPHFTSVNTLKTLILPTSK